MVKQNLKDIFSQNAHLFRENNLETHLQGSGRFDNIIEQIMGGGIVGFFCLFCSTYIFTSLSLWSLYGFLALFGFGLGAIISAACFGVIVESLSIRLKWFPLHKTWKKQEHSLNILLKLFKQEDNQFAICYFLEVILHQRPQANNDVKKTCEASFIKMKDAFAKKDIKLAVKQIALILSKYDLSEFQCDSTSFNKNYEIYKKQRLSGQIEQTQEVEILKEPEEKEMEVGRTKSDYKLSKHI